MTNDIPVFRQCSIPVCGRFFRFDFGRRRVYIPTHWGAGLDPAERMLWRIDPLNLIRVMPAKGDAS